MSIKRYLLKKKAVTIGAVLLTVPLLFGFKTDSGESLDNKSSLNAQTDDATVNKTFEGKINSTEETVTTEERQVDPPKKIEYDRRDSHNNAEYIFSNLKDVQSLILTLKAQAIQL